MKTPHRQQRKTGPDRRLAVSIAVALAVKAAALTAIYLAFFQPTASAVPPAERAAAVLGLR